MRNTSKILSIFGYIIAFTLAGIFLCISITFRGPGHPWLVSDIPSGEVQVDSGVAGQISFLVAACLAFIAGALGLYGSLIVKRKHVLAGVITLIAAILSLFSYYNILSFLLFLLSAIFAFKKEKLPDSIL